MTRHPSLKEQIRIAILSAKPELEEKLDRYRPWNGECADIAMALYRVFGPEDIRLCSVARQDCIPEEFEPDHIFIEVESSFIDGRGVQTEQDIIDTYELALDFEDHFKYETPESVKGLSYYVPHSSIEIQRQIEEQVIPHEPSVRVQADYQGERVVQSEITDY